MRVCAVNFQACIRVKWRLLLLLLPSDNQSACSCARLAGPIPSRRQSIGNPIPRLGQVKLSSVFSPGLWRKSARESLGERQLFARPVCERRHFPRTGAAFGIGPRATGGNVAVIGRIESVCGAAAATCPWQSLVSGPLV